MNDAIQNERLRRALNDAAPAIWDWDPARGRLIVTEGLRAIYGFGAKRDLVFQDLVDAIASEDIAAVVSTGVQPVTGQNIRYRIHHPGTGIRWLKARVTATIHPDESEKNTGFTGVVDDITDEVDAALALTEGEERLRFAVEAGRMAIWENDLQTGAVTVTPDLNEMFGFPRDARPTLAELRSRYAPGELERVAKLGASWEVVKERIAKGDLKPRHITGAADGDRMQVQTDLSIVVPPGETKHLLYRAQYVYSRDGRPRITGFLVDITEKRRAEDRLAVIARELRHRVQNSFAVVQALAVQTFRNEPGAEAALRKFLERMKALTIASDIVLHTEAGDADVKDIVERITAPYRQTRHDAFQLTGPSIRVAGAGATAFSMLLHELCTNALKYGSLSNAEGKVRLDWQRLDEGRILMEWLEVGGPEVVAPNRHGFGTKLLSRVVADTLLGELDIRFEPGGLVCKVITGKLEA